MSRRFIIAIAALILVLPGLALLPSLLPSAASTVPVEFNGTTPGTGGDITMATVGGVTGPVTWSGDTWTMTVDGQIFATGTLTTGLTDVVTVTSVPGLAACKAGCTATLSPTLAGTLTGQLSFVNHGAWVSAVAHWGSANGISHLGALVSGAAKATTHKATGDPTTSSTTTNSTGTTGAPGRHGGSGHNAASGSAGTSGGGHSHGGGNSDLASAGLNAGGGGSHGGGDHGGGGDHSGHGR